MKRNEIEALLPGVFQRTLYPNSPLFAILEVMEALHAPAEEVLERLPAYFNPYHTSDEFTPYLAQWVDMTRVLSDEPDAFAPGGAPLGFASGLGRLRDLIASAALLSKWRGTKKGLTLFLEVATGVAGFSIQEQPPGKDGQPQPFHIRIQAPDAARVYHSLIERIVEQEKPAYVTYELIYTQPDFSQTKPSRL